MWNPLSWWPARGAATDHQAEGQNAEQVGGSHPLTGGLNLGYSGRWLLLVSWSFLFLWVIFVSFLYTLDPFFSTFYLEDFLLSFLTPLVDTRKPCLLWVFILWCCQYTQATSTLSRFDMAENVVIVASQKRPLGGRELQLPSMSMLTSKTSTQKFFLRVLQVIIQLRDDTRRANKKAKQTGRLGMELECPVEGKGWWR